MPPDGATILHADLDAFYASVEQLLDPSLRGLPIAVGGGVVLAASYEAKRFGVQAGMSGWRARQLCPNLRFVGGHFEEYQRLGDEVIEVLYDFTPFVERISIDEAFLDVAGAVHLFGPPREIGAAIRRRVRAELGLPISVGVATTKHLAKVASQVAKPDGMVVVEPNAEREFLDPLPVELLWGVGPVASARLADAGITTIGQLATADPDRLRHVLGDAAGTKLGSLAHNIDPRGVDTGRRARSIGAQSALGRRFVTDALLGEELGFLADRVATRLRASHCAGRTITVRVRFVGMRAVTRSVTTPWAVSATRTLTEHSVELAKAALADHPAEREITLVAVSVSNLVPQSTVQLELELGIPVEQHRPGTTAGSARSTLDRAMDRVRAKYGKQVIGHGSLVFREPSAVPDAFRELAERDSAT